MRILSELIGGVVLLLIFAYGVRETIKFFSPRQERQNGNSTDAAGNEPD